MWKHLLEAQHLAGGSSQFMQVPVSQENSIKHIYSSKDCNYQQGRFPSYQGLFLIQRARTVCTQG